MEYTWTKTPAGAVRMVVGVKDEQPLVFEATVIEIELSKVKTRLALFLGDALAWEDICNLVDSGEADLAIGTDTLKQLPNLVKLPCFSLPRSVVAKIGARGRRADSRP